KQSLETFVPKLKDVTFQEKLGSLFDKTERILKLADFILKQELLDEDISRRTLRTAYLCKADLVTTMLGEKEFTKLQGYIGMEYADKSGEEPGVPTAIFEHYLPRGQNDRLPNTIAGSLIAIADKMDTVCGIFGVNMIPTGSNDPFALRRAANGIVQIIDKNNFEINLHSLIDQAFSELKNKLEKPDNNKDKVYSFFKQRIKWLLQQKEIDYDVIDSVMHIDFSNIPDLIKRAEVLQKFKQREDFIRLVLGFKRVSNIITEVDEFKEINTTLFQEDTEIKLFEKFLSLKEIINKKLLQKDYDSVLNELVDFSSFIDNFFDDVMVNVEDKNLRNNRYHLLSKIRELFLKVADLAKIVVEGETK
ncbi:MAG TPA: glycine--tRNA ligase subunit beta, partial [Candidatus Cloacimonetes bacterium]|nr:glycine--tRNA ligase subunit beta [Candidatus Cloacimonadota bacterium]